MTSIKSNQKTENKSQTKVSKFQKHSTVIPPNESEIITNSSTTKTEFIENKKKIKNKSPIISKFYLENLFDSSNNIEEKNFSKYIVNKKKKKENIKNITEYKKMNVQSKIGNKILTFPLFDDKLIFSSFNNSYLQDCFEDLGCDSSDEKIESGCQFVFEQIEHTINILNDIKQGKKKSSDYLSRNYKFKEDEK